MMSRMMSGAATILPPAYMRYNISMQEERSEKSNGKKTNPQSHHTIMHDNRISSLAMKAKTINADLIRFVLDKEDLAFL